MPAKLDALSPEQRRDRLVALAIELYGRFWQPLIAVDMRVTARTVRRWVTLDGMIPTVVLVAAGALLAVKRANLREPVV